MSGHLAGSRPILRHIDAAHEARRRSIQCNPRRPAYCETGRPYLKRTSGLACLTAVARKIPRYLHEDARDAARAHAATPEYVEAYCRRKKVEMLFAHLNRILRLAHLRLRGPNGGQQRISPRRYCPKLETTRPLKTDEYASGNVGRVTPGMAAPRAAERTLRTLLRNCEL
jgi:hypothetical protein